MTQRSQIQRVKDVAEFGDVVWAPSVAATAWSLWRAGIAGTRLTVIAGVVSGLGSGLVALRRARPASPAPSPWSTATTLADSPGNA